MPAARIAILHTSTVFVSVEPLINNLISELLTDVETFHLVDSDVLATVIREDHISAASEARMGYLARAAEAANADIIFSACSSLGPAVDVAARGIRTPVVKIDEAMAMKAVQEANRIGVLATVPTTLGPSSELLRSEAEKAGREVDIVTRLSNGAFGALMGGSRAIHDEMVLSEAVRLADEVDLIVLAQASMSRLEEPLQAQTGRTVLSSPRLGVEYLARRVAELAISPS